MTKVTYIVQSRNPGARTWKDTDEYDDLFSATDYRDDALADGDGVDYRVVERTATITDVVIDAKHEALV